jgi:hypothetical protein
MSTELDTLKALLETTKSDVEGHRARLVNYREDYRLDPAEDTAAMVRRTEAKIAKGEANIKALEYAVDKLTVVEDEDYTMDVEFIRIHDEGDGYAIDGSNAKGKYTEEVWKYDTIEEAIENVPAFIRSLKRDGYDVKL